ncbi:MAG TPA: hypothetical protein VEQ59_04090 [Polyangiaceae bacterium]|nr:hypothetical protein [Polyangiaceae bacterium]
MIERLRATKLLAGVAGALMTLGTAQAAEPAGTKPKAAEPAASDPTQPSRAQCLEAHRNAQELKQSSKLLEMQEQLLVCSSGSCPGAIISDCGNWITELEQTTPSMVFEIRVDGKEAFDAKVSVDGQPVVDRSKALKVNPGRHAVRVELPPFEPRDQDVVLPEGQRMRLISVEFTAKKSEPAPAPAAALAPPPREIVRPTPVVVYPLLVLGVAGLGSFGAFSFLGKSEQNDLEKTCSPSCKDSDLKAMKRWYAIGDVSAGVGAAALIGAAVVYLARPSREVDRSARTTFGVGPVGLGASASGSLGLNAARTW